jgi:hypothetical protein
MPRVLCCVRVHNKKSFDEILVTYNIKHPNVIRMHVSPTRFPLPHPTVESLLLAISQFGRKQNYSKEASDVTSCENDKVYV